MQNSWIASFLTILANYLAPISKALYGSALKYEVDYFIDNGGGAGADYLQRFYVLSVR